MKKATKGKFKLGRGAGVGMTFAALALVLVVGLQSGSMTNLYGKPLNGDEQRLSQIIPFAGGDDVAKKGALGQDPYNNQCGGNNAWIGHEVDEAAIASVGNPYRILPPGSMVTMDHNPMRINVHLDDNNIVIDITCG